VAWRDSLLRPHRRVTFGVSVDDPMSESENRRIAVDLMHMLTDGTEGTHDLLTASTPAVTRSADVSPTSNDPSRVCETLL
jgi:hypothetical protein